MFLRPMSKLKRPSMSAPRHVVFASAVWREVMAAIRPKLSRGHEGIVYFGGFIHDHRTVVLTVLSPEAQTTRGSFNVTAASMASVINHACALGLEIVGQLHTHPGEAFHSDGDVEGATLVRPGYLSIVVPLYGRLLPSVSGSCLFSWERAIGFVEGDVRNVALMPSHADCR